MKNSVKTAILEHINESFRIKEDKLPYISTPLHYHPHYELVWIKQGYGVRVVGDHVDHFKSGDMVLLAPNLPHVWENDQIYYKEDSCLEVDVFVIHFTNEIIQNLLSFPELTCIIDVLNKSKRGLRIMGKANEEICKIIEKLTFVEPIERIILFLRILQILVTSNELTILSSLNFIEFFNHQKSERLCRILEYIRGKFSSNIQIEEISAIACMSPTAFCRYFKKKTGVSFVSYLNDFRLRYARNLLDTNEYKISAVAEMCGFSDISYFNRMFKRIHGMTPSEYKHKRCMK